MSYRDKTITTATERYFWRCAAVLAAGNLMIGLGMIFGAPTVSPSYDVAKSLLAIPSWGIVAVFAALLFYVGMWAHNRWLMLTGLTLGGFYTTLFGLTFVFAAIAGTLHGFTAVVWWLVIGALHTMAAMTLPSTKQIKRLKNDYLPSTSGR